MNVNKPKAGFDIKDLYDSVYTADKNLMQGAISVNLPDIPTNMRAEGGTSPRTFMETNIIKNLITSYYDVVRKNVGDLVPKTVMAFLVNQSKNIAQRELVQELYKENNVEDLLSEDPIVQQKR